MKRLILFTLLIIGMMLSSLTSTAFEPPSTRRPIPIEIKGKNTQRDRERTGFNFTISAYYDTMAQVIVIGCDLPELDGEVYLMTCGGLIAAYRERIVTTLDVSGLSSGTYTVRIEGDDWIGTGSITI